MAQNVGRVTIQREENAGKGYGEQNAFFQIIFDDKSFHAKLILQQKVAV